MTNRRQFLTKAGTLSVGAAGSVLAAPAIVRAQTAIKWRLQTYAGSVLGQHVTKPIVDMVNETAKGELEIELYFADQIVPTGELFRALQAGTIDAVHSDDDSMASPAEVAVFGGYFPLATKQIMDVPVLFRQYGLGEIWKSAYEKVGGVVWLSSSGQDPCHFNTKKPINALKDLDGLR
ncbi:MAG: C4-dicarboxylate ABC transporter, partial [Rhizobiaceae bacterium]|nr:C4-dicarboxylate ABC transporter [Rhizobiaceae bacterium]